MLKRALRQLTMPQSKLLSAGLLITTMLLLPTLVLAETTAEITAEAAPDTGLKQVEAKFVCMVNDALFAKEQIPVEVGDNTYYGCCAMCEQRLANDQAIRQATDPVSGATVDKATAIIGASEDGTVYYFENEETFGKYAPEAG
jgi:YHS domain-containing protein